MNEATNQVQESLEQPEQSQPTFTPKKKIATIEDVFSVQDSVRTRVRNLVRYLDENLPTNLYKTYVLNKADELVALATESLMDEYQQTKGSN